jgi:Zn-dependent protease with chaperone function
MDSPDAIPLTLDQLTLPKEKTYFTILLIVSILLWIIIAVTIFGIFYALLIGLVAWMASGLLAARLKSESVEVTCSQLPVLYATYEEVCTKLGLTVFPAFYLLQGNGVLNAFATRHSGRNFVVIYSNMLEALGHNSTEVRFLIGHEIGHIQRNHLLKRLLLLPSAIIPLLGKAYHRACEATCDRFGVFAAGSLKGASRGLLVLGGGREAAPQLDPATFARQYFSQRGFFVSWHELAANYPTLSQRVAKLLGINQPEFNRNAPRNPLAYICAPLFSIQSLIIIYLAFILGAIALPAMKQAKATTQFMQQQNGSNP